MPKLTSEEWRAYRAGLKYKKVDGANWIINISHKLGSVRPIDLLSREPDRLREHDSKDAAVQPRRCFNPQCSKALTTAPYELWVHVSCTATDCIAYLHDETAQIQTALRSLDSSWENLRSMKCTAW